MWPLSTELWLPNFLFRLNSEFHVVESWSQKINFYLPSRFPLVLLDFFVSQSVGWPEIPCACLFVSVVCLCLRVLCLLPYLMFSCVCFFFLHSLFACSHSIMKTQSFSNVEEEEEETESTFACLLLWVTRKKNKGYKKNPFSDKLLWLSCEKMQR